ncbi:carbonic anhydrase [Mycena amicta]|nr:carbonic anhydrase [Mycena amicta]
MSSVTQEILQANEKYSQNFAKPTIPRKDLLVVTCMDPRIQPYEQLGLRFAECGIVRNAGGSAQNAIADIIVAQHYGLRHIAVIHHTDCGMTKVTTQLLREEVKEANPASAEDVEAIEFHEFTTDIAASVRRDVDYLLRSPVVRKSTRITGWVYDVESGKLSLTEDVVV